MEAIDLYYTYESGPNEFHMNEEERNMYPRPFTEKQMRASIQGGGADNMETRVSRGISYRLFRKTIEEVLEITDLTWAETLTLLKEHDSDIEEFLADLRPDGPNSLNEYTGAEVLGWLGY